MSTAFFSDPQVVDRLLEVCQGEGWIASRVRQKVATLIDHGLHPEQALIGSGLLDVDRYGEALSQVFGLPFVHLQNSIALSSILSHELLRNARAAVVDQTGTQLTVAFLDPLHSSSRRSIDQAAALLGYKVTPLVALWSHMFAQRPASLSGYSIARLRRALQHHYKASGTAYWQASDVGLGWQTDHEGGENLKDLLPTHPSSLSALHAHLTREEVKAGFHVSVTKVASGSSVFIEPKEFDHHPLQWSNLLKEHKESGGVCVFVHPNKVISRQLSVLGYKESRASDHWREASHLSHIYDGEDTNQCEEAIHAALSGRSVVLFTRHLPSPLLSSFRQADIPVRVFERVVTPEGIMQTARLVSDV